MSRPRPDAEPVAVGELEKGKTYTLASVSNADGTVAVIWHICSVGPKWLTLREWREPPGGGPGRWAGMFRLLRSGWAEGRPFVPIDDPSK